MDSGEFSDVFFAEIPFPREEALAQNHPLFWLAYERLYVNVVTLLSLFVFNSVHGLRAVRFEFLFSMS